VNDKYSSLPGLSCSQTNRRADVALHGNFGIVIVLVTHVGFNIGLWNSRNVL
jgi:hypothetical protein